MDVSETCGHDGAHFDLRGVSESMARTELARWRAIHAHQAGATRDQVSNMVDDVVAALADEALAAGKSVSAYLDDLGNAEDDPRSATWSTTSDDVVEVTGAAAGAADQLAVTRNDPDETRPADWTGIVDDAPTADA